MKLSSLFAAVFSIALLVSPYGAKAATESILYNFQGNTDGSYPTAGLVLDANGVLYGTTNAGGADADCGGCGTVFKLTPPAVGQTVWSQSILYRFHGGMDGVMPNENTLIADASGALYGTTYEGGGGNCSSGSGPENNGCGTVFKLTSVAGEIAWKETVLHRFRGGMDGQMPTEGRLVLAADGTIYGATPAGGSTSCASGLAHTCGVIFALTPPAPGQVRWTERVIHRFFGEAEGFAPADLISDADGALYGSAANDETCATPAEKCYGLVFRLSPPASGQTEWKYEVLYRFTGGSRGKFPGQLSFGANGVIYGTTSAGGNGRACQGYGCGTVFSLTPSTPGKKAWVLKILHRFTMLLPDGGGPLGALLVDSSNTIYGTTSAGGYALRVGRYRYLGGGTVYKLTPPAAGETKWTQTTLHNFPKSTDGNAADGSNPFSGIVMNTDGIIFGTTIYGGSRAAECARSGGCGTIYKVVP